MSKLKEKYYYLRDKVLQPNKLFYLKIMLGLSMLAIIIIWVKKKSCPQGFDLCEKTLGQKDV